MPAEKVLVEPALAAGAEPLVGYRLIYFLLPLVLATGIWVLREARVWYRRRVGTPDVRGMTT